MTPPRNTWARTTVTYKCGHWTLTVWQQQATMGGEVQYHPHLKYRDDGVDLRGWLSYVPLNDRWYRSEAKAVAAASAAVRRIYETILPRRQVKGLKVRFEANG
jgi:hypothetical protein